MKKILMMAVLLVALCGCVEREMVDPNSGKVVVTYQVDPNKIADSEKVIAQIQAIAATTATVAAAATPIFSWAAPIAAGASAVVSILGTIGIIWAKIKPKLTEARTKVRMYHTISSSTVLALEEFKKLCPDQWTILTTELEKIKAKIIKPEDWVEIENLIRGLRGLPPVG